MLGINTFGISHLLKKDFDGTVTKLRVMGITSFEPCVVMTQAFGRLRRLFYRIGFGVSGLDGGNWFGKKNYYRMIDRTEELGVNVLSVHCALCDGSPVVFDKMLSDIVDMFVLRPRIINFVVSLNLKSKKRADKFIPVLNNFIKVISSKANLIYHNHDSEIKSGTLDYLMSAVPELGLELDTGWAAFAGADPLEIAEKYAERLKAIHLKDFAFATDRKSFVPVGDGILPLKEVVGFAMRRGVPLILDEDKSKDMFGDIAKSIENIRKYTDKV